MKTIALLLLLAAANARGEGLDACSVDASTSDISMEADTAAGFRASDYGMVSIQCPAGVAFQVEAANARPGGVITTTGLNPGNTLPVRLTQADNGLAFGAASFGEAINLVGNDAQQVVAIKATVAADSLPAADTYSAPVEINLIF